MNEQNEQYYYINEQNKQYPDMSEQFKRYPDMLGTEHIMEIFGMGKNSAYKMIREGAFGEVYKFGRAFKISKTYVWNKFLNGLE